MFNLALDVLSTLLVVDALGFQNSLPKEVVFYRKRSLHGLGVWLDGFDNYSKSFNHKCCFLQMRPPEG